MDAFSNYNQIMMDKEDQEKTMFITSQGLYYYKVMSFGLKNAGATYQRLVNHMFSQQIGRNVEEYVDDTLVKSNNEADHLDDLRETFNTLHKYKMKQNPMKFVFAVSSRKFLGFMAYGQIEVLNRSLLKIIKTQLEEANSAWPKELPNVLWVYKTTTRVPIGETPFRLTFGTKAVVPMEVGLTSIQIKAYEEQKNQQELNNNLDLIDEVRNKVMKQMAKYKEAMARYYNKKIGIKKHVVIELAAEVN
nr:uncharacterized protein LOC112038230 [Quercus suber]